MSRPVVCGLDGSEGSLAAAAVAAQLADALRSRLLVAQVLEGDPTLRHGHELQVQRRWRRAGGRPTGVDERVEERASGVEIEDRVLHGDPASALAELAREADAALIVVGSRGRGGVKAALLGSVSSATVRTSDRPVVIVPPDAWPASDEDLREQAGVVCGIDGSEEAAGAARVAARLADALELELVLVHAYEARSPSAAIPAPGGTPAIDYAALNDELRKGAGSLEATARAVEGEPRPRTRVERGDAASALDRSARDERAALIAVGTRARPPLASALLGSTSTRLVTCASRPVVLVPDGAVLPPQEEAAAAVPDDERRSQTSPGPADRRSELP